MRKIFIGITLALFTCLPFAQERNLKLVKNPTENPTNQRRKAVVVGMSSYGDGRSLENTLNDVEDMAEALTQLGFVVTVLKNNDLRNLKTNLTAWYNTIEGNDMAVFYFAGHGVEVKGENYLIPIGAELNSQADVEDYTLKVNNILGNMEEKRVGFKLLILDACRDNPFTRSWSRSNTQQGLAQMRAPKGMLIAFAAAPGATAQDGGSYNLRNGVFTHFLKQEILTAGASIDDILNKVAGNVSNLTNDQQVPYKTGVITENFYFIPKMNEVVITDNPAEPTKPAVTVKYFYYIDQSGKESQNRFNDRKAAENDMRKRNLYGKIYSNAGEVFVVEKPAEPVKPVTTAKSNGETVHLDGIEFVFVSGGAFTMGCTPEQGNDCSDGENPAHRVTVSDFYMGKYEVTQALWKEVMGDNPSSVKGDNLPVDKVSWNDVQEFIRKLNIKTGKQYRLPTEAEWEFAARGGIGSGGYKYSGSNTIGNVAWYKDNAGGKNPAVGTKSPNELGIHDMSGNVFEWCSDWNAPYNNNEQTDPQGPATGTHRVFRGGCLAGDAKMARITTRTIGQPDIRWNSLGFRLACSSK